jgi:hypothetical protein
MPRATADRHRLLMHSEYLEGLLLRPLMDAGYTAWRDGRRVGLVRYVDGSVEVEADDDIVRRLLVQRLEEDLRAAGITRAALRSAA